nr:hypothetical protein [Cupriavidus sp. UYPR2.512]
MPNPAETMRLIAALLDSSDPCGKRSPRLAEQAFDGIARTRAGLTDQQVFRKQIVQRDVPAGHQWVIGCGNEGYRMLGKGHRLRPELGRRPPDDGQIDFVHPQHAHDLFLVADWRHDLHIRMELGERHFLRIVGYGGGDSYSAFRED